MPDTGSSRVLSPDLLAPSPYHAFVVCLRLQRRWQNDTRRRHQATANYQRWPIGSHFQASLKAPQVPRRTLLRPVEWNQLAQRQRVRLTALQLTFHNRTSFAVGISSHPHHSCIVGSPYTLLPAPHRPFQPAEPVPAESPLPSHLPCAFYSGPSRFTPHRPLLVSVLPISVIASELGLPAHSATASTLGLWVIDDTEAAAYQFCGEIDGGALE